MQRFWILGLVIGVLAIAASPATAQQVTLLETYETHDVFPPNWGKPWFGTATVQGRSTDRAHTGASSLKVNWLTSGGTGFAGIDSDTFLPESHTSLTTGLTVMVYTERVSGSGAPQMKFEISAAGGGAFAGPDTPLVVDAWTPLTLPAGNITGPYEDIGFVLIENGSNGEFNMYLDTLKRDDAIWDDFETPGVTQVDIEAAGARGEASLGSTTLATPGPAPTQGGHLLAMNWSGEGDATPEVNNRFASLDLSGNNQLLVDVNIPSGTALPTVNAFLAPTGGFLTGSAITANDQWQTVSFAIPETLNDVDELKLVFSGAGASGTVYVDNLRAANPYPVATAIERLGPAVTDQATADFTVRFSEPVSGVGTDDFTLTLAGNLTGASIASVSPASGPLTSCTVSVNTGSGDGAIRLDLADDNSIIDAIGAPLGGEAAGDGDFTTGWWQGVRKSTPLASQGELLEAYETQNLWQATFGQSPIANLRYDDTHTTEGATALAFDYQTSSTAAEPYRGLESAFFLTESGDDLTTGFTLDLYLEAGPGATGTPSAKFELLSAVGGPNDDTGDVTLAPGWNRLALMPGKDYEKAILVFGDNGSSGTFSLWVDNIRREGLLWNGFEDDFNAPREIINTDGNRRGAPTQGGVVLTDPGPWPVQGEHAYGLFWDGDADGQVELSHDYPEGLDLSLKDRLYVDVYVSTGTQLPEVLAFFTDGLEGSVLSAGSVSAPEQWQRMELDLTLLRGAPIDESAILDLVLVFAGAGNSGRLFIDNLRVNDPAPNILSILRAGGAELVTTGTVQFVAHFSEPVTGVTTDDFLTSATGLTGAAVTGILPAGGPATSWTLTVSTGNGQGSLGLTLIDDDSILDSQNTPLGGPGAGNGDFDASERYLVGPVEPSSAERGWMLYQ